MRQLIFKTSAFPVCLGLTAVCLTSNVVAHQWDPLKRAREKAEQLKKKVECALNDPACVEKAKKEGAEVKTTPPVQTTGAPPAASLAPLNALFTSTPLAPLGATPSVIESVVVSDDGARAAGVAMRGSRHVVVVDGHDGPLFDQILPSAHTGRQTIQGAAAFSPGGKRVAYIGVRAGAKIAVIDGKEEPPFNSIELNAVQGDPHQRRVAFRFSEDGSRVAYVGVNPAAGNHPRLLQVVLDGTPGPRYARITDMTFAGKRHAYVAHRTDGKQVLVVDGKEQASTFEGIQSLRGNKDGHIAFLGSRGNSFSVVVDGVEGKAHEHPKEDIDARHFVLASSGKRAAYVVRAGDAIGGSHLYVDGKIVRSADEFANIVLSPDGTRVAGSFNERGSRVKVFVDDWTSLEYEKVADNAITSRAYSALTFSPDSKSFAAIVQNGMQHFVIVDGKESSGYLTIQDFRFSPDGRRYAFEARQRMPDGSIPWLVVIDGKDGPSLIEVKRHSLTFSPDGSRVAYAGQVGFSSSIAVIDGKEHKIAVGSFQPRAAKMLPDWGFPLERSFVFSRDSKHLAYVSSQGGPGAVVVVDGQPQASGHMFMLPTFSPDGKRFAHLGMLGQKWFVTIDGNSAPVDGEVYEAPNSLAFQDDGSVRFLVAKDNMLHRVVVIRKSGTN